MTDQTLASTWTTSRCWVRDAVPSDATSLTRLYNSRAALGVVDPTFYLANEQELLEHIMRSREGRQFLFQAFGLHSRAEPLGYFHMSLREPRPELAWISMMVVGAEHAGQGLGRDVGSGLLGELGRLAWCDSAWLKVYLANTAALRYWVGIGFRRIVEVRGTVRGTDPDEPCVILAFDLR